MKDEIKSIKVQPAKNGYIVSFKRSVPNFSINGNPILESTIVVERHICEDFNKLINKLIVEGFSEKSQGPIISALIEKDWLEEE